MARIQIPSLARTQIHTDQETPEKSFDLIRSKKYLILKLISAKMTLWQRRKSVKIKHNPQYNIFTRLIVSNNHIVFFVTSTLYRIRLDCNINDFSIFTVEFSFRFGFN